MAVELNLRDHRSLLDELIACFSGLNWLAYRTERGISADDFMLNEWKCNHLKEGRFSFNSDSDMVEFMLKRPWEDVPWKQ